MPGDILALRPHALDLGGIDRTRPAEALGDAWAEARIVRIDPGAVPPPDFVALENAKNGRPCRRIAGIDLDPAMLRKRGLEPRHRVGKRRRDLAAGKRERVFGDQQALRQKCRRFRQHDAAYPRHRFGIAREPSDRIEARGKIRHAVDRSEAMGGADAVDAAIARWQAHRSAAIRAERKVDQAA